MDSSESESTSSKPQFPIVCRMSPGLWWLVLPNLFMTSGIFWAPFLPNPQNLGQSPWQVALICWPFGLIVLGCLSVMISDLCCGEIRADETGLTWRRNFGRQRSVRWNEITDFYQTYLGEKSSRIVVTPVGNLELSRTFRNIEKIVEILPRRATAVGKPQWEMRGFQQGKKWPVAVKARSSEDLWLAPASAAGILFLMGLAIAILRSPTVGGRPPLGFWLDVVPALIGVVPMFALSGLMLWMQPALWRRRKFARRIKGEKITFDPQGLTFTDGEKTVSAQWDEVRAINYLSEVGRRVPVEIRTAHGDFRIWKDDSNTGMWPQVAKVLRQYVPDMMAVHDQTARQRSAQLNDLDGERGAWTAGVVGVGSPRWSFRSYTNRFLGLCASFVAPFVPLVYLFNIHSGPPKGSDVQPEVCWPLFIVLIGAVFLFLLVGWVWYFHASIVASEEALEIRFPFGLRRRAPWGEIEILGRDAFGDFVKVKGRKLHFTWFVLPVRVKELRGVIEQRIRVRKSLKDS